jgi:bifunctional N-acetylglucosamine-1-phosphate-uridyltransferase/glucosamine-1-phosphate-acetyltransferase GlmU-like protein
MITLTFEELEFEIQKQGPDLVFNESIKLKMTELPNGIQSITVKNDGSFDGDKLTKLPDGITIKVGMHIWLDNLTTIGNDIAIKAVCNIYLNGLIAIGNNAVIKAGWDIKLNKLTIIEDNIIIEADMNILLNSLTTIGNNVRLKAKWGILFNDTKTGLTEITLIDDSTVPNEVKQFLIDKKITVKCPETSPLINLAFDGILMEILY